MPEFSYEAMATGGARTQGTLVANSEREVMAMLDARGLFPVRIAPVKALAAGKGWRRRIGSRHLATYYSQLADLLIFFVPRFEPIFKKLDEKGELPTLTVAIVGLSHLLQSYGVFVLAGAVGLYFLFRRWAATDLGRYRLDALRLRLPGAGKIYL